MQHALTLFVGCLGVKCILEDMDFKGIGDIGSVARDNSQACARRCSSTSGCNVAVFTGAICYLKSVSTSATPDPVQLRRDCATRLKLFMYASPACCIGCRTSVPPVAFPKQHPLCQTHIAAIEQLPALAWAPVELGPRRQDCNSN